MRSAKSQSARVLIVYASGGMGHVKAAHAIASAFAANHPMVTVQNVNILDFARPSFRFLYEDGYNFISAHWTTLWGWLYRRYDHPNRHGRLVGLTRWAMEEKLLPFLRQFRPDFIIGTHPMPTRLLAHVADPAVAAVPTAVVVTDYGCHSFWVDQHTARYYVSTGEVKSCLGGFGVPPDRVAVTGIPVDPKFSRQVDVAKTRRELGLDVRRPVVLAIGGLFTAQFLEQLIVALRRRADAQFLVVTGRDYSLQRQVQRSALPRLEGVKVFGFISNLEALLSVSDLVITKAGGLTVSECLAIGVPLAIPSAIPGQEEDNLAFLLRHRVAVSARAPQALANLMVPLLSSPAALAECKARCRALGKPQAAADLADDVLRYLGRGVN